MAERSTVSVSEIESVNVSDASIVAETEVVSWDETDFDLVPV